MSGRDGPRVSMSSGPTRSSMHILSGRLVLDHLDLIPILHPGRSLSLDLLECALEGFLSFDLAQQVRSL